MAAICPDPFRRTRRRSLAAVAAAAVCAALWARSWLLSEQGALHLTFSAGHWFVNIETARSWMTISLVRAGPEYGGPIRVYGYSSPPSPATDPIISQPTAVGRRAWGFVISTYDASPTGPYYTMTYCSFPLLMGLLLLTTGAFTYRGYRLDRRATAAARTHCPRCGYDLRATPDRCPECGNTPQCS
jgi:hypothetical protein